EQTTIRRRGPARRWLEALPLGNGRLGAMAWGDPQRARFSLNESTLWSGTPARASDRDVDEQTATAANRRARDLVEHGEGAAAGPAPGASRGRPPRPSRSWRYWAGPGRRPSSPSAS